MKRDSNIAWFAVAAHVVASAAMLFVLRHGFPPNPLRQRAHWILVHPEAWFFGWFTWQVAVLSLIAFYVVLARRLGGSMAWTAVAITTAGAAIDISTNVRYIVTLRLLAHAPEFELLERELEALTGYAANGLYTISLLILAFLGRRVLPGFGIAMISAAGGVALAFGALFHIWQIEMASSAILFPAFTLWMILIARWLRKSE